MRAFRMAWQVRCQMRFHTNWPHTRATAAMRDSKGFVQIEVRNIAADFTWLGQPNHGVQVGPVDINLPAKAVGDLANVAHRFSNTPWVEG